MPAWATAIARLSVKVAFEEFHKVFPDDRRVQEQLGWMPSSTFRSPLEGLVLSLPDTQETARVTPPG